MSSSAFIGVEPSHSGQVINNSTNWGASIGLTLIVMGVLAAITSLFVNTGFDQEAWITLGSGVGALFVGGIILALSNAISKKVTQDKEMNILKHPLSPVSVGGQRYIPQGDL